MNTVNIETGILGEKIATDYLIKNKFKILNKNYKFPYGEIDIIAKKNNIIHFIEVKSRNSTIKGYPYQYVTTQKISKIKKCIDSYVKYNNLQNLKLSLDILSIIFKNNKNKIDFFENITS